MSADLLLAKLEGVRKTGTNKWIARCPSHDDKSPSLAIRECDDRTTLIHCFAQCLPNDVLAAVGLDLRDLFPARLDHAIAQKRRPFDPQDMLRCVAHEVQIVACVASDILNKRDILLPDWERTQTAANRLWAAVELANGR